jgi:hypothetical protein
MPLARLSILVRKRITTKIKFIHEIWLEFLSEFLSHCVHVNTEKTVTKTVRHTLLVFSDSFIHYGWILMTLLTYDDQLQYLASVGSA